MKSKEQSHSESMMKIYNKHGVLITFFSNFKLKLMQVLLITEYVTETRHVSFTNF
jgi:hypothetical protein